MTSPSSNQPPQVLAFINGKGGVGKTTATIGLALALESAKQRVAVLDLDPQQTSVKTIAVLREQKLTTVESVQSLPGVGITIIDTPPTLDDRLLFAARNATHLVLVASTSPADLWRSQDTVNFLRAEKLGHVSLRILFNRHDERQILSRDHEARAKLIGAPCLKNTLGDSTRYQHMFLKGWLGLTPDQRVAMAQIALEIFTS